MMSKTVVNETLNFKLVITDNSEEVLRAVANAIDRAFDAIGETAVGYAEDNITKNKSVNTGNLRGSLLYKHDDKSVIIGTNVEYGKYVELGHRQEVGRYVPAIGKRLKNAHVPPKPFLKPAITEHIDEYKELLKDSLENA